jgi:hypothetical protein
LRAIGERGKTDAENELADLAREISNMFEGSDRAERRRELMDRKRAANLMKWRPETLRLKLGGALERRMRESGMYARL